MRAKSYPKYRDSGVKWLGEIPEHWQIKRLRYCCQLNMGQSPSSEDCNIDEVGVPFLQGNAEFGKLYPTPKQYCEVTRKISKKGDMLISVRAPVGALNIADQNYGIGRGLCAITVKEAVLVNKFCWYLLHEIRQQLNLRSTGSTYEAVSSEDVGNLALMLPSLEEQRAISAFLDQETERIDQLIARKECQIELLQEKRSSLISHVITKGLNPNVKMKDSGIEWLGKVPEHWEVKRVKNVATVNMGQSPSSEDCNQEGEGVPFLQGNADFGDVFPSPRHYCAVANKLAQIHDILFSVRAPVGAINVADQVYGIGRGLCAITPVGDNSQGYMLHGLEIIKKEFFSVATGSTYDAVSLEQVGNARCLYPPPDEQRAIATFLDCETTRIDTLIEKVKYSIEKLREYRTALISAAVTGKIDIRKEGAI